MDHDELEKGISRALLPVEVLALLKDAPLHGYALLGELHRAGYPDVKSGTLYPMLRRMETGGLVSSEWELQSEGAARKIFTISPNGESALRHSGTVLQKLTLPFVGSPHQERLNP